ncbi:MAG: Druantia anti-phage system protein DruA [Candidatus Aminicenantia bacterium]
MGFQPIVSGSNPLDRTLNLESIKTKTQRFQFNQIVKKYHSYKQSTNCVGRRIDWFIKLGNRTIGTIGIGSGTIPEPKALTDFIGWDKKQRIENFNKIANNWRFTLIPNSPKNLASRTLSLLCRIAPKFWKEKYGDKLVLLFSFVREDYSGNIYKASGWEEIGFTTGIKYLNGYTIQKKWKCGLKYSGSGIETRKKLRKRIFVKPLHRYWRRELLRVD